MSIAAVMAFSFLCAHRAGAEPSLSPPGPEKQVFALIVGVNQGVDTDLPALAYADDDAVRYYELFRALGARAYLLTRPDANTRQVFANVIGDAREPRAAELWKVASALTDDIAQARLANTASVLYIIYAGHGGMDKDAHAYITLEDARLGGEELGRRLVDATGADQTHVVVDACYSYYLAYERGPGGTRREAHGFSEFRGLASRTNVGLLLSTSSARESHEWEGFQAGVFSHEIRSGLYGAADVDRDGRVSYREIAAFVARANQAITNDRFRPDVYARPPSGESEFVDLRAGLGHTLIVDREARGGHYYLEDERGNRLADFHNAAGQALDLVRPPRGPVYLHRLADDREFQLHPSPAHLVLSQLESATSRSRRRGAAQNAFNLLFSLPFDEEVVQKYAFAEPAPPNKTPDGTAPPGPARLEGQYAYYQPKGYWYGYHLHDKLYLRAFGGLAYFRASRTTYGAVSPSGTRDRTDRTYSGQGTSGGAALGGVIASNLILYVELAGTTVTYPLGPRDGPLFDRVDQFSFGPGVAYYLEPSNLCVSSTLTFPKVRFDDGEVDESNFGVGLNLMISKEWWLSGDWGVGVAVQAHLATVSFEKNPGGGSSRTFALLFSATYN
jgi:hypothetical protein